MINLELSTETTSDWERSTLDKKDTAQPKIRDGMSSFGVKRSTIDEELRKQSL